MAIPYDFNPVGKAAGSKSKAKTSTIWEITTTGANNTYRFRLSDYQGETNIIDWGDGTITQSSSSSNTDYTHTYTNAGTYTINVLGNHVNIQLGANVNTSYGKYVSKVIQLCDSITSYQYLFSCCSNLTTQMLPEDFITVPEGITSTLAMFRQTKITSLPEGFTIPNSVTNCDGIFYKCSNLTSLPEGFTIPNYVTDCHNMFFECSALTSLPDGFTISNSAIDCQYMFYYCRALTSLPDGFTIPNSVTYCQNMFYECAALTSLPDGFTIPNSVTNCQTMFSYCQALTSLPDGFTIPNSVTNCQYMFGYCRALTSLSDGFTIPNSVTNCVQMFLYCNKLNTDIGILLSQWTAKSRSVSSMFNGCTLITGIAPADVLWNNTNITSFDNCFISCTSLDNYYSIPYSWGGGGVDIVDQNYILINVQNEIQITADGGGTLTFTSENLPEGVSLSSDGKLTGFSVDGTYTINVKCSSSYGTEASAVITVYVNQTLQKTQNNLTSNTSSDFVVVYDQGHNVSAYKAMDGDLSTYSSSSFTSASTSNFRIDFSQPIITKYIWLKLRNNTYTYSYYLQASTDGNTWIRIYDQIIPNTFDGILVVNLDTPYQYYRLLRANSGYYHYICEIIFYYENVEGYLSAKDQTINANINEQFSYNITYENYSDNAVVFSIVEGELPAGITFDTTTGTFSGITTDVINTQFNVKLNNEFMQITISITLNIVDPAGVFITPHNLTSNTSDPRYILSMSDNLQSAKRHAWNAMDGSLDQEYGCAHTGIGSNKWWKIQFVDGSVYIIDFVWTNREMNNVGSVGGAGGTSLILQGSTDDNTWVDVYPFNIDTTNGKIFEFVVNSQQAYKYWRIFQTGSYYLIIGQIEFHYKLQ